MKKRIISFILLIALQTSLFSQVIPVTIVQDSTTLHQKTLPPHQPGAEFDVVVPEE